MRPRDDELTYLRRVELLARGVCDEAINEGWLSYRPDPSDATPLQQAVNELARSIRHQHYEGDGCCPDGPDGPDSTGF